MIWLIYIINMLLWSIAGLVLMSALESAIFGTLYFIIGYPLSILLLKYSDDYAVSYLDKFKYPPFTIWKRKLLWSNGVATMIIWIGIVITALVIKNI